ncbi:bifunctional 4-hydroxy-2-oxoglutarate aldolase/2-dehydro-3-deoxy-phosphogluconate aldolase [Nocardioides sp.]|uniref:bifunctional 4-hydroxy-2-oxoglutarate aldolase/2-dehydro-3-deoxy-phosphogluconate aldolase n=1 Tax=Nocardioides sp. TaxID=35761 RepID=UPI0026186307|nr:bifunctional 4-hydroxy-2-oxoglutarate aldolase/2-dehydro-3-deoxy-phosphogluconate aldolase [Nocardioides sp.]MDI6908201.1 bifunctional 4-hydroxy-2-oxoglutarate aldolase/2-dehydro-3-deoxy-phosphogluconate aldolase [Nocardioides sp.]
MSAEEHVRAGRLVAIIRVPRLTPDDAIALTEVLVDSGVRALEFTLTSRGALAAVAAAVATAKDRATVGAGTVLAEDDVRAAADAGAQFVVSPNVSPPVIRRAEELGLLALPGAYTPTEILTAVDSGARLVKLFPAQPAGVTYLRALLGPLPDVGFVPTGGVGLADVPGFLEAGAVAVALGSSLVKSTGDLDGLRLRARGAVQAACRSGDAH